MLLQSHAGELEPLPALPKAWPAGSVRGLRARGGFEVDIAWKDSRLTAATIRNANSAATVCQLRYGEKTANSPLKGNTSESFDGDLKRRF
jgi:alpha-L-fucosidase 2